MSTVHSLHRMSEAQYEAERAKLPADKDEAGARFEQQLAILFYRSGWTQEQLAAKEGKSQSWISYQLRFGRFLDFNTTVIKPENLPRNLSERKFRSYWEQTNKDQNERARFSEAARLMRDHTTLAKTPRPQIGRNIIAKFGDGKWHDPTVIARALDVDPDHVSDTLSEMRKHRTYGAKCEQKQVGPDYHYRIFHSEKQVSTAELAEKLRPIIKKLKIEGKASMATMSPINVAILAGQLEKLLEEWMQ